MDKTTLGDRMKRYEQSSRFVLTRRMPVIIRIDGNAFHTYTKGFSRPFDDIIIKSMVEAAKQVSLKVQGFKAAYIQSDEASFLLTDYDNIDTEAWFDYNVSKVVSISASIMTAYFNETIKNNLQSYFSNHPKSNDKEYEEVKSYFNRNAGKIAFFDSRVFNIPKEDVINYFKWRQIDWFRNSLSMYCGSFYSSKQMHGKNRDDQHEMLYEKGKNWTTDLDSQKKNATFLYKKDRELIQDSDYIVEFDSFYEKFEGIN